MPKLSCDKLVSSPLTALLTWCHELTSIHSYYDDNCVHFADFRYTDAAACKGDPKTPRGGPYGSRSAKFDSIDHVNWGEYFSFMSMAFLEIGT